MSLSRSASSPRLFILGYEMTRAASGSLPTKLRTYIWYRGSLVMYSGRGSCWRKVFPPPVVQRNRLGVEAGYVERYFRRAIGKQVLDEGYLVAALERRDHGYAVLPRFRQQGPEPPRRGGSCGFRPR